MKNFSRQREAILKVLRSTDTHPNANWIYNEVRKELPNISLGTVYRNLSELSKNGDILNINLGDGFEHFDGDIKPHLHLCCTGCNSVTDLPVENDFLTEKIAQADFTPQKSIYLIYGICKNCNQNLKN